MLGGASLRFVYDEHLYVIETSTALVGARGELHHAAVGKLDGFLTVGVANETRHLPKLGLGARPLEILRETRESLPRRVDAVGGVQDVPAQHRGAEQLEYLDAEVLAVLTRHEQPACDADGLAVLVACQPVVEDVPLPFVQRIGVYLRETGGIVAVGYLVVGADPNARLLTSCRVRPRIHLE